MDNKERHSPIPLIRFGSEFLEEASTLHICEHPEYK